MTANALDVGSRPVRLVVTGAGGQLGRELQRARWPHGTTIVAADRSVLDITDAADVSAFIDLHQPDIIVNAAAYTAVDRAEDEPDAADAVNHVAVAHLATAAERCGARLIHISTDYVFDGTKDGWYVETDPVAPLGVYGRTKAAGEEAARRATRHLILRTAWVYGALGSNFVTTMRRVALERQELRVVADQVGCPSSAADIAAAIVDLSTRSPVEVNGTFHLASPSAATWYEFAMVILQNRIATGRVRVDAITTAEYPTRAQRPRNSRLDSTSLFAVTGIRLREWRDALPPVLAELDALTPDHPAPEGPL